MNRQEREAELRNLLTTQRGKEEILEVLKKHAGIESGNLPPFGTLLVETILNYEFSTQFGEKPAPADGTKVSASETSEAPEVSDSKTVAPGDIKFDEPPGRESPGG